MAPWNFHMPDCRISPTSLATLDWRRECRGSLDPAWARGPMTIVQCDAGVHKTRWGGLPVTSKMILVFRPSPLQAYAGTSSSHSAFDSLWVELYLFGALS